MALVPIPFQMFLALALGMLIATICSQALRRGGISARAFEPTALLKIPFSAGEGNCISWTGPKKPAAQQPYTYGCSRHSSLLAKATVTCSRALGGGEKHARKTADKLTESLLPGQLREPRATAMPLHGRSQRMNAACPPQDDGSNMFFYLEKAKSYLDAVLATQSLTKHQEISIKTAQAGMNDLQDEIGHYVDHYSGDGNETMDKLKKQWIDEARVLGRRCPADRRKLRSLPQAVDDSQILRFHWT
jgi:hypothetical protein